MNPQVTAFYELRFRAHFLESKGAAFQDLFVVVMSKAHPDDFIACRPWGNVGDRKNDGYLRSERTLFQVYAPSELRVSDTVRKIDTDFKGALPYWEEHFDTWVFVHNSPNGLPPEVIGKLLELDGQYPAVKVTQWGYEELLQRFRLLSTESLRSLYGSPPPGETSGSKEARRKVELAQDLLRGGKHSEAVREMREALVIARAEGDEEEEVEILLGLALLSSDRRGRGERQAYFQEAANKADKLKTVAAKVIYLRTRAAVLEQAGDLAEAEAAYREALEMCSSEPEDDKGNLATQGCIARSSLVHLLCRQQRLEDATSVLEACEDYARANKDAEEGELFQAALEAGIHLSIAAGDEEAAISRISELERSAVTSRLAYRIGGDLINVANHASHRKSHRVALAAAEACVRLAGRCDDTNLLLGALYNEAAAVMHAGDDEKALSKAEALLELCRGRDAMIEQATHHLIAEVRRCSGDSQAAVVFAQRALQTAGPNPMDVAFTKLALARALNDDGQTEEALRHAKEAWVLARIAEVPARGAADLLCAIANYASQLGFEQDVGSTMAALAELPDEEPEVSEEKTRAVARVSTNRQLRERFIELLAEPDPAAVADTCGALSLPEANSLVVRPLLRLWRGVPECVAETYDFWGRGNFERLLLNARCFPNSFNITIEVRTLEDVKKAVRLWGVYADFLILLWKGPTENGMAIVPFPADYTDPGGWGYWVCAGDVIQKEGIAGKWHPALGYITMFPKEVAHFLATEALPFIEAGRLVVVPAAGVGCINPGHGPFEQLLAEAANALPSIRWKGFQGSPIGFIPYSPDAPIELLAELAETESDRLRKLRLLLLRRSRELQPNGELAGQAKLLALEIDDALRDLEDRSKILARRKGVTNAREPVAATTTRFRSSGKMLSGDAEDSPYAPLLLLQHLGYGWRVEGPAIPRLPARFKPQEGDAVGAWLAPPTPGWSIPVARKWDK